MVCASWSQSEAFSISRLEGADQVLLPVIVWRTRMNIIDANGGLAAIAFPAITLMSFRLTGRRLSRGVSRRGFLRL
jgi:hypothetical protein